MREIFNPVCKKYTNRLSISNNPSDCRKYKLLKSMIENKQENKIVCQKKRNGEKKDRLISRKENANSIDQIIVLSEESEAVETEDDVEDEDYIYEGTKPPKKKIYRKDCALWLINTSLLIGKFLNLPVKQLKIEVTTLMTTPYLIILSREQEKM